MKRIVTTAMALSMLTLAAPGIASAAHNGGHHRRALHARAHARHARRVHVLAIGAASGSSTTTNPSTGTTTTPTSNESGGTVTSYTNGVLTITLNDGTTMISGQVTEDTQIGCRPATPAATPGEDQDADDQGSSAGGDQGAGAQGANQQGGQDGSHDGGGDQGEESCTTAALVKGAIVRRAELRLSSFGAVWEKIDLIQ
jgi:hypothetical protein